MSDREAICRERFKGRNVDRCLGCAQDGRQPVTQDDHDSFCERNGIEPTTVCRQAMATMSFGPGGESAEPKEPQRKLTLLERAVSVASACKDVIKSGGKLLTEEQISARLAICQACDQFEGEKCKLCGCGCSGKKSLINKLAHPGQECPHDPPLWGKVE